MQFNVPQFISIEDKIVGPFTAKQLGWLAIGGIIFLILWSMLDTSSLIIAGLIDAVIFGALAFYKPYSQPLNKFLMSSVHFFFRPKIYVWKRNYDNIRAVPRNHLTNKKPKPIKKKVLKSDKIKEISKRLDGIRE